MAKKVKEVKNNQEEKEVIDEKELKIQEGEVKND